MVPLQVRVGLRIMAINGCSHFPKLQHYWSLTIRLLSVISRTLVRKVLPLCWDAVGVFCSSSWLGQVFGVVTWSYNHLRRVIIWSHIDMYKSFVFDRKSWNHLTVGKTFVLDGNIWYHITVSKQTIRDKYISTIKKKQLNWTLEIILM